MRRAIVPQRSSASGVIDARRAGCSGRSVALCGTMPGSANSGWVQQAPPRPASNIVAAPPAISDGGSWLDHSVVESPSMESSFEDIDGERKPRQNGGPLARSDFTKFVQFFRQASPYIEGHRDVGRL